MPYKNSSGNTGIASQYGQWRYFNASLQKLGDYRSARIDTRVSGSYAKAKNNYFKALSQTIQLGLKAFEGYRDYSYDLADKYVDRYGLEAYNKAMVDNQVPIQNNPLAMQRIRFRQGQILSGLENIDFKNRIDKGEFVGKSPFEVETAMIESKETAPEEASPYLPFDIKGDYFFNEGYWGGSEKQRDQAYAQNANVTTDRVKEQAFINVQATLGGLIDEHASPQDVFNSIDEWEKVEGIYYTPAEKQKLYAEIFSRASEKEYGREYLDYLADKKIPNTNSTFRDLYGDDAIRTMQVKADNRKLVADGERYYNFKENVDKLTTTIDGGLKLKQMLDEELRINGNLKTEKTDMLYSAIQTWEKNQKTQLKDAQRSYGRQANLMELIDYYSDYCKGANGLPTEEFKIKEWADRKSGITENDRKVAQQIVIQSILGSDDLKATNTMLTMITKGGAPRELKTYTGELLGNLYGSITKDINKYVTDGVLPNEQTEGYAPIADSQGRVLGYAPQGFSKLMELYNLNPSAIADIIDGSDTKLKRNMKVANMAVAMGKNPIEILGKSALFEFRLDQLEETTGAKRQFNYSLVSSNIRGFDARVNQVLLADTNDTMKPIIQSLAETYILADKEASISEALSKAKVLVQNELAGINNFVVPQTALLGAFGNVALSNSSKEDIIEIANDLFKETARKIPSVKQDSDFGGSLYDSANNRIVVIDLNGNPLGQINMSDFANKIRERFDNSRK